VIERFLFDGIDAESAAAAVGRQRHLAANVLAHKTKAPLPGAEFTDPRAQAAFEPAIRQRLPPASRVIGL
jgi:hypothetical protein